MIFVQLFRLTLSFVVLFIDIIVAMSRIVTADALSPGTVTSWRKRVFEKCFENLTTEVAKTASLAERSEKNMNDMTLLYGEMEFSALKTIFSKVDKLFPSSMLEKKELIFVDLGSGSGKACIASALFGKAFAYSYGVEILTNLLDIANKAKSIFGVQMQSIPQEFENGRTTLIFENGNITEYDLSNADVVLANSTGFDQSLMKMIAKQAAKMKTGSIT